MKITNIAEFDGGEGRTGCIELREDICSVCRKSTIVIAIDPSEEEYNAGCICIECIIKSFQKVYSYIHPGRIGDNRRCNKGEVI